MLKFIIFISLLSLFKTCQSSNLTPVNDNDKCEALIDLCFVFEAHDSIISADTSFQVTLASRLADNSDISSLEINIAYVRNSGNLDPNFNATAGLLSDKSFVPNIGPIVGTPQGGPSLQNAALGSCIDILTGSSSRSNAASVLVSIISEPTTDSPLSFNETTVSALASDSINTITIGIGLDELTKSYARSASNNDAYFYDLSSFSDLIDSTFISNLQSDICSFASDLDSLNNIGDSLISPIVSTDLNAEIVIVTETSSSLDSIEKSIQENWLEDLVVSLDYDRYSLALLYPAGQESFPSITCPLSTSQAGLLQFIRPTLLPSVSASNHTRSLLEAYDLFSGSPNTMKHIIILSDNCDSCIVDGTSALSSSLLRLDINLRISTIWIGSFSSSANTQFTSLASSPDDYSFYTLEVNAWSSLWSSHAIAPTTASTTLYNRLPSLPTDSSFCIQPNEYIFILDSSSSLTTDQFETSKAFMAQLINLAKDDSLARFSSVLPDSPAARLTIPLTDQRSLLVEQLSTRGSLPISTSYNVLEALELAQTTLTTSARSHLESSIVLIASGDYDGSDPTSVATSLKTSNGIPIIVIGVGLDDSQTEFYSMLASSYIAVDSYTDLDSISTMSWIRSQISRTTCRTCDLGDFCCGSVSICNADLSAINQPCVCDPGFGGADCCSVLLIPGNCGNGIIDVGEDCDPPGGECTRFCTIEVSFFSSVFSRGIGLLLIFFVISGVIIGVIVYATSKIFDYRAKKKAEDTYLVNSERFGVISASSSSTKGSKRGKKDTKNSVLQRKRSKSPMKKGENRRSSRESRNSKKSKSSKDGRKRINQRSETKRDKSPFGDYLTTQ